MEKSNVSKTEETLNEDLPMPDPEMQEAVSEVSQSDQKLQERGDLTQNEASKFGLMHEIPKTMQQEKDEPAQKAPIQDSPQESESSQQECEELSKDEELEQEPDMDMMLQQKDDGKFASEQDSRQTRADAMHHDKPLEMGGNEVQSAALTLDGVLRYQDQNSILVPPNEGDDAIYKEYTGSVDNEMVEQKSETSEQEANDALQQGFDRYAENDPHLQEVAPASELEDTIRTLRIQVAGMASSPIPIRVYHYRPHPSSPSQGIPPILESGETNRRLAIQRIVERASRPPPYRIFHHYSHMSAPFQEIPPTSELEETNRPSTEFPLFGEILSRSIPRSIYDHPSYLMLRPRLPPAADLPLEPFEEEISDRTRRPLRLGPPTLLPTGRHDYMQRLREHHIPPARRVFCEELQSRCVKVFFSLLFSGILVAGMYLIIDYLEDKYGSAGESDANSLPNSNANSTIPMTELTSDPSMTEASINSEVDLDTGVIPALNDTNGNVANGRH